MSNGTIATAPSTCHFCGNTQTITTSTGAQLSRLVNTAHWTGTAYIRIDRCDACAPKVAKAPRKTRKPRTHVPATDWNMLVAFTPKKNRAK